MANIIDKINEIRQAIFGKDVRESIAEGIESINTEVENTTARQAAVEDRQDNVENTFQEIINMGSNPSAEVTQARGTAPNLGTRLDGVDSQLADMPINVKSFGAKGDGVNDDTVSIQNAINYAITLNLNKAVYFPSGIYKITGTITIVSSLTIKGDGFGSSILLIDSNLDNNTDILVIQPNSIGSEPYIIEDISIIPESGTPARDILRILNTSSYGTSTIYVNRCQFKALGGGHAINGINSNANINANGIPMLRFSKNILWGGVKIENAGDSCVFEQNNIKGKNIGLDISMVKDIYGWSSHLSILDNNIVNDGGAIKLNNVRSFFIERNNIEQRVELLGGYAVRVEQLTADAIALTSTMSVISKNKIECASPVSKAGGLYLKNCKQIDVSNNYFSASPIVLGTTGADDITVENCENINIKFNELYISRFCVGVRIDNLSKDITVLKNTRHYFNIAEATDYIDSGIGTIGIPRTLTSLTNFENYNTTNQQFTVYKDENKYVTLSFSLKPKTGRATDDYASGDVIVDALPPGFIPDKNVYASSNYQNTGGLYNPAYWRILTDGTVKFNAGISDVNMFNSNNIRYKTS